jgi:hypothetical protein
MLQDTWGSQSVLASQWPQSLPSPLYPPPPLSPRTDAILASDHVFKEVWKYIDIRFLKRLIQFSTSKELFNRFFVIKKLMYVILEWWKQKDWEVTILLQWGFLVNCAKIRCPSKIFGAFFAFKVLSHEMVGENILHDLRALRKVQTKIDIYIFNIKFSKTVTF